MQQVTNVPNNPRLRGYCVSLLFIKETVIGDVAHGSMWGRRHKSIIHELLKEVGLDKLTFSPQYASIPGNEEAVIIVAQNTIPDAEPVEPIEWFRISEQLVAIRPPKGVMVYPRYGNTFILYMEGIIPKPKEKIKQGKAYFIYEPDLVLP